MPSVSNFSEAVNAYTGGSSASPETLHFYVDDRAGAAAVTAPIAGKYTSFWTYNKHPGGGGAAPGAVAAPTGATAGAIQFTAATGGRTKYISGFHPSLSQFGSCMLYDRLLHISGLSGTSVSAQTVGGTLTRNTGGAGNFIAIEIYTIIGTTAQTITASYTNQAGTPSRTTQAVAIGATNNREVTRFIILPLQDGDTGVQAVASVTLSGSTGTAGDFGVVVGKFLTRADFMKPPAISYPSEIALEANACLAMYGMIGGTTAPTIIGTIATYER